MPGFEIRNWLGLVATTGTPRDIVDKLSTIRSIEILRSGSEGAVVEKRVDEPNQPEYFVSYLEAELKYWAKVVKDAGITAD